MARVTPDLGLTARRNSEWVSKGTAMRVRDRAQLPPHPPNQVQPSSERLADLLAERVMGWAVRPDRYQLQGRKWIPRWRFQPDRKLDHAFDLLDRAKPTKYSMGSEADCDFWVRVTIGRKTIEVRDKIRARAISLAIAKALGLFPEAGA